MDDRTNKWLEGILIAIDEVDDFFEMLPKKYDTFVSNLLLRRAVERNIEIIGEAMSRVLKYDSTITINSARKIIDAWNYVRNYVTYSNDSLTADILWSVVINHLPTLRNEIQDVLKQ